MTYLSSHTLTCCSGSRYRYYAGDAQLGAEEGAHKIKGSEKCSMEQAFHRLAIQEGKAGFVMQVG